MELKPKTYCIPVFLVICAICEILSHFISFGCAGGTCIR